MTVKRRKSKTVTFLGPLHTFNEIDHINGSVAMFFESPGNYAIVETNVPKAAKNVRVLIVYDGD